MQKSLTQMNLFLHNVISDITGKTGMLILDAILAGEHNPKVLASYRNKNMKADEDTIAKSLEGDYKAEHLFTLKQAVEFYRYYKEQIRMCDKEIEGHLKAFTANNTEPDEPVSERSLQEPEQKNRHKKPKGNEYHFDIQSYLSNILGVDLTAIPEISALTAHTIFTEIGLDIHKFKTRRHFTSWLSLSPNNKVSGNKILSSKTLSSANRVAKALRLAAYGVGNSKSYIGEYYRKMRSRLGAPKAITATAHKLARIVYVLLTTKVPYDESIFAAEEMKNSERKIKRLNNQARQLGLKLVAA